MATLADIAGGLLGELTRSRVAADLLSRELFASYQADPVLSQLPVPRALIREAQLTLRFGIKEHTELAFDQGDFQETLLLWRRIAAAEIAVPFYSQFAPPFAERELAKKGILEVMAAEAWPEMDLTEALAGRPEAFITQTMEAILAPRKLVFRRIAPEAQMPQIADLRKEIKPLASAIQKRTWMKVRDLATANAARRLNLSILVRQAELAQLPVSSLHEMTLTIQMDDLLPPAENPPLNSEPPT